MLDRLGIAAVSTTPRHPRRRPAQARAPGYRELLDQFGIDPARAVFVEDMVRNLAPAKALGMTTLWVDNGSERGTTAMTKQIVDVRATDIGEWLEAILGETNE